MMEKHYSIAHTHGNSYEEALKNAKEVLSILVEDYQARGKELPQLNDSNIVV